MYSNFYQMTGLDHEVHQIMSVCCFITDANLNLLHEDGFEAIVHHDASFLANMDEWCTKTHGQSGLTDACIRSTTSPADAAESLLEYIRQWVPRPGAALLAGNSVHCDKAFLSKRPWKVVLEHLHYRILDVSSIKEAARRWAPDEVLEEIPMKKGLHQAREDVLESIEEAKYYRDALFRTANTRADRVA
jgi:oligoribonuclease